MKIFKIFSNVNFYLLNAKSTPKNTAYSLKPKAFVFTSIFQTIDTPCFFLNVSKKFRNRVLS